MDEWLVIADGQTHTHICMYKPCPYVIRKGAKINLVNRPVFSVGSRLLTHVCGQQLENRVQVSVSEAMPA
jgi:hypothetical protein